MGIRMTGLVSGMDTEGMVQELVKASSSKVDKVKKEKQLLEWKKESWQDLNTKLYNFYKTELSAFKTNSSYKTKKATVNDETKASITASGSASNGTHTVSVKQLASSAYLTGANIKNTAGVDVTGGTKLTDLGVAVGTAFAINGKEFVVDEETTLSGLASGLSKLGVSANFDANQGRFYLNANGTGAAHDFTLTSTDENALKVLGLDKDSAVKIDAQDAIIEYNGVEYKNSENTFNINGLSITAKGVTGIYDKETGTFTGDTPLSITVAQDTDSMYDTIKTFVKKYNELIDEMNKLYDEKKTDYEPLTEEERSQLSEKQIEQWEEKAKQGLLRRDSTISSLLSNMRGILNKGVTVTNDDGTTSTYTLASLGIVTGDYSEKGKLHILGDEDDPQYASETNKLKEMLASKPDVFSQVLGGTKDAPGIGYQLYEHLNKAMGSTTNSSALTFYDDKLMNKDIEDMDEEIDKWADKLQALEDKYYDQFAAMESAMAKLQSQQSYISSLMGM